MQPKGNHVLTGAGLTASFTASPPGVALRTGCVTLSPATSLLLRRSCIPPPSHHRLRRTRRPPHPGSHTAHRLSEVGLRRAPYRYPPAPPATGTAPAIGTLNPHWSRRQRQPRHDHDSDGLSPIRRARRPIRSTDEGVKQCPSWTHDSGPPHSHDRAGMPVS